MIENNTLHYSIIEIQIYDVNCEFEKINAG